MAEKARAGGGGGGGEREIEAVKRRLSSCVGPEYGKATATDRIFMSMTMSMMC